MSLSQSVSHPPPPPQTQTEERDTHLLFIGQQCSHSLCYVDDFLPFKCPHCDLHFCQDHYRVEAHKCSKYDARKHDRIAPCCPLCNTLVSIKMGQDPNEVVDLHLETNCSVVTGKVNERTLPICARGICKKILFVPILCKTCKLKFCPYHRHPDDHYCSQPPNASLTGGTGTGKNKVNLSKQFAKLNAEAKIINAKAGVAGNAAMGAVKKSITTTAIPAARNAIASASNATASKTAALPFSKMNRRARAERESKLRAMQARAKKGLLTEEEKAILASEEAAAQDQDNKDCLIM